MDSTDSGLSKALLYSPGDSMSPLPNSPSTDFPSQNVVNSKNVVTFPEQAIEASESPIPDEDSQTDEKGKDAGLNICQDMESASTTKAEEYTSKDVLPFIGPVIPDTPIGNSKNSETSLVMDIEKTCIPKEQEEVSSTINLVNLIPSKIPEQPSTDTQIQNETVQTTNSTTSDDKNDKEEENIDSEETSSVSPSSGSIASVETPNAEILTTDTKSGQRSPNLVNIELVACVKTIQKIELPPLPSACEVRKFESVKNSCLSKLGSAPCGLYSDSEDESIVKITKVPIDKELNSGIHDETDGDEIECTAKSKKSFGLGLGDIKSITDDVSEEERSYTPCLDEHSNKEGLEGLGTEMISDDDRNDFDESHEQKTASEGDALEINAKESELDFTPKPDDFEEGEIVNKNAVSEQQKVAQEEKEPEKVEDEKERSEAQAISFKKLSKSKKERNYRDKDKENTRSSEKSDKKNKEKRKEIQRYNVKSIIVEKSRRNESGKKSPSRLKRSSPSKRSDLKRAHSREKAKKPRARTKSKSRSPAGRRRSRSPRLRRAKSRSREREERRERVKSKERLRRLSKRWSRSITPSPETQPRWSPTRVLESQPVKPPNLTVILNNDHNQRRREKRKRDKQKELERSKRRKKNQTPPPSKEVFASGNNILVSVSFNKDKNQRDVTAKNTREITGDTRRVKDSQSKSDSIKRKKKRKKLEGVQPVAIIDLDRSPFGVVTPSADVIVLTDSENAESNDGLQKAVCDSSEQVADSTANYSSGPKTPPEPQVKFTFNQKQTQLRAINNPLHEADDVEEEGDPQGEADATDEAYKGPNTPPETPTSAASSPDVYDPFEPTKSRSATPEPSLQPVQLSNSSQVGNAMDSQNEVEATDQSHMIPTTTDTDSHCSNSKTSPEKSPEVVSRIAQPQAAVVPTIASKSTSSFSNTSVVTSTPSRSILSSTILTPTTIVSALPQRIVLPNTTKSSPVRVLPNKQPIKSIAIKPMPAKNSLNKTNKSKKLNNDSSDVILDLDSPYSPGSSDYEDLFEPPTDAGVDKANNKQQSVQKSKNQSGFDTLFVSPPANNCFKNNSKAAKGGNAKHKKSAYKGTKHVGVKVDENTLKILDELPNSAVEMQVKDKFVDDWVLSVDSGSGTCTKERLQYLKKLNRQERVVEEVKLVLKPHYNKKHLNKDEYKDILRRAVPKICHSKSGEINPQKIQNLIEAYVKKIRHSKKVTSSSSVNPPKA